MVFLYVCANNELINDVALTQFSRIKYSKEFFSIFQVSERKLKFFITLSKGNKRRSLTFWDAIACCDDEMLFKQINFTVKPE